MAGNSHLDPQQIISHKFPETTFTYTERDAALYAIGVGACLKDAVDDHDLKYLYHPNGQPFIQVLPTFSTLVSYATLQQFISLPVIDFDPSTLLHGQHYIEIYKQFPSSGCIQNKAFVTGLHDKGKAAIIEVEILSYEKDSNELLCMNRMSIYIKGVGGFSKSSQLYSYTKNPSNQTTSKIPNSQPFAIYEDCSQQSQALLYRLSGDYNPLHSDLNVAENAGFSRPILHGLCTLGFAVRAVIKCICKGDQNMIKNISCRFLLHVYPGETFLTEMWLQGLRVLYQVKVKERNKIVLAGFVDLNRLSSSL